MTVYSQADLATRMLKDLGLVGSEETPSAPDLEWAQETVGCEVAMLGSIGLPIWNGSDMAVPQEYLTPLSRRCGLAVAPSFGLMDQASAQLAMREAERYLTVMASPRLGTPLPLITNDAKPRRYGFNYTTGQ
ncbi:hypothetical protein UFOVP1349_53 [uncultured Caudovirales phage]|uniref:Uncharacterized protein n=1 Tax=uncultured Caudovirales phage TaxID=2100421 RepID=A0A6J5SKN3_9CAUD|nr:hypothetical protein UFOVP925_47 [uncultured Caudovirales phage]CAB4183810.1 hypothetical protein UFOVP1097_2 [uncultured Caudovirales phage]CAB4200569.1 hypothetical protein UFOVP1349_53 [uncultured Caudovirales phage]CAB4214366.1 hypothetical protein UFOVP1456_33 [uncultured Caudovirales phage]